LRLTSAPLRGFAPRWSPDGKRILFTGIREGQSRYIYFISPDGGSLQPVLPAGWEGAEADWSPDGYRIVVSMRHPKIQPHFSLYTLEPTTGTVKHLPNSNGLGEPRWSPDGRYIAALDESRRTLFVFDVPAQTWSAIASGGLLESPRWTKDSSAIYFQDELDSEESVFQVKMASRHVAPVIGFGELLRGSATHCYFSGLSPDGSLYVMVERGLTDIYGLDLELP
jgi:Tol biopolymer transport system component